MKTRFHYGTFANFLLTNARWLAVGFTLFFLSSFGQTYFLALNFDVIGDIYGLSQGDLGVLVTLTTLGSGVTLLVSGHLADRFSAFRLVAISLPLMFISFLTFQVEPSLPVFVVNFFVLRVVCQGYMTHFGYTIIGRWFSSRRGVAISLTSAGQNVGQMVLPVAYLFFVEGVGWHSSWLLFAGVIFILTPLLAWLSAKERSPSLEVYQNGARNKPIAKHYTLQQALKELRFYFFVLAIIPMAFVSNSLFFSQTYWAGVKGWSLEALTASHSVMALVTILSSFLSGALIDRYSAVIFLPFYLLPLVAACVLLVFVPEEWVIYLFMALLGVSNGFSLTLFGAVWPEVYGTHHLGAIRAMVTTFVIFAAASGPGVVGILLDQMVPIDLILLGLCGFSLFASIAVIPSVKCSVYKSRSEVRRPT